MTRLLTLTTVSLILVVPTLRSQDKKPDPAKKDTHDLLAQETIKNIKDTTKVLKDVQNKEQADKAKKDPVFERIADVKKRYLALTAPTKEQEAALEKKFKNELEDASKAFTAEFVRLVKADYAKDLVAFLQQKKVDK